MTTITISNEEDMRRFAERMAERIAPGTVIGLVGDLGAGKTTFVRYFAKALGVASEPKSPTFILLQKFRTAPAAAKRGIMRIWHADAYRVEDERELWTAGLAEAVADDCAVTLVEWADKLPALHRLPNYAEFSIVFGRGEEREIIGE